LTTYKWLGSIDTTAYVTNLGFIADLSVEFDYVEGMNSSSLSEILFIHLSPGLQYAYVYFNEYSPYGEITLSIMYSNDANCTGTTNYLAASGEFHSNFSSNDVVVDFNVSTIYDMCTKDWKFSGSADEIEIYGFLVTDAVLSLARDYHGNSQPATYDDLAVKGNVQVSSFSAEVTYNYTGLEFSANISYASTMFDLQLQAVYTPNITCTVV
jgi:FlaG/FlaF family flagellin (archaellin)